MDLRSLKQFLHLAQSLHFGKTSEAMHLSPSTLSRSISRLEDEVGQSLFERDNRTVALTHAGVQFRQFAEDTLNAWQALQRELHQTPDELTGQIRIYCTVTASYSFMADLLSLFRSQYPQVEVILETGDAALALQRVQDQVIDLAVAPRPDQLPSAIEFQSLVETPLVFVAPTIPCPVSDQLKETPIPWSQVPMVISEFGLARKRLEQWCKNQGIKPRVYAQVAGHEAIVSMVGLGFGVGVVPGLVLDKSPMRDRVRVLDVEPELQPFDVGLCALKRRMDDPLVSAFWSIAQQNWSRP